MSMAVGLIVHADQAEQILQQGRADLIALARELLYNPNWPMDAAQKLGVDRQFGSVPSAQAYWLAKRAQSVKSVVPSAYRTGMNATRQSQSPGRDSAPGAPNAYDRRRFILVE